MKKLSLWALACLIFCACSSNSENELQAPTVKIIQLANETEEHDGHEMALVEAGEELYLNAALNAENGIKSYKIDIHFGEGHDHDHRVKSTGKEWQYDQTVVVDGNPKTLSIDENIVTVPEMIDGEEIAEGKYHFAIYVIDQLGNEDKTFQDLLIHHHDHDH
ncbi:DUF4625 domain-containing protein [Persicobacter psychrovividus]|uniref:DUF4625 domain-containing protein n=1 Tax=Persicobacter psychrovividus TaxID=387638 RepID=A0ABM7VG63_9BACT|nr:hypothetical protein PEPS_19770 [Persicobacter psychrovividus]